MPRDNALARTVIQMDEAAHEERQRLKRQILAAAEDHEAAPRSYIANIRQNSLEGGYQRSDKTGNSNSTWR